MKKKKTKFTRNSEQFYSISLRCYDRFIDIKGFYRANICNILALKSNTEHRSWKRHVRRSVLAIPPKRTNRGCVAFGREAVRVHVRRVGQSEGRRCYDQRTEREMDQLKPEKAAAAAGTRRRGKIGKWKGEERVGDRGWRRGSERKNRSKAMSYLDQSQRVLF